MRKTSLLLLIATSLGIATISSCRQDHPYSYDNPTIYSESDKALFSEVMLYVSPYLMDGTTKRYVVTEKLEDLILSINGKQWAPTDSHTLDVSHITGTREFQGFTTTTEPIKYPFTVSVRVTTTDFTTAGEYALLLRNYFVLQPGSYVCRVVSFATMNNNSEPTVTYTPTLWSTLEVAENHVSASLGEFDVKIN